MAAGMAARRQGKSRLIGGSESSLTDIQNNRFPPVDDAADSSSQQSEADTVDDGIADSAPAPV